MLNDLSIRVKIIDAAKRLYQKNMLAAADGNISYKISDDCILMTPAGVSKAYITPEDLAVITLDNKIIAGNPSSERLMHLGVYNKCPQAKCVVHAHPPTAIAWTIAKPDLSELPSECLSELILGVGRIPIAPYARPGTVAMSDVLFPLLLENPVMILARHGALAWAGTLEEAVNGIERLEHTAEILLKAEMLGGITRLPEVEVAYLREKRKQICENGNVRIL
ncbi:MAG: class II aldolase/adducin family protein [Parachlamydiales bacterium]